MAAGTMANLNLDGISYDVAADADFSEIFTKFKNTMEATSGDGFLSQEKQIQEVSGVVVITKSASDKYNLKATAEKKDPIAMTYTNRQGESVMASGSIDIENNTTMKNRTSLKLLPIADWTQV